MLANILPLFGRHNVRGYLGWSVNQDGERVYRVACSDVFYWGCADAEPIEPADIPALQQAFVDCGEHYKDAPLLFCARKRRMRPQGALYRHLPEPLWDLFDKAGPARDTGFGNPKSQPKHTDPTPPVTLAVLPATLTFDAAEWANTVLKTLPSFDLSESLYWTSDAHGNIAFTIEVDDNRHLPLTAADLPLLQTVIADIRAVDSNYEWVASYLWGARRDARGGTPDWVQANTTPAIAALFPAAATN